MAMVAEHLSVAELEDRYGPAPEAVRNLSTRDAEASKIDLASVKTTALY